jgi:UDP-glucose 4-epimerase
MTALVIGGSGFLGHALVHRLVAKGMDVVATSRKPETRFTLPGLHWRDLNLSRYVDEPDLLAEISVVYHLGWSSIPSTADLAPADDLVENVPGSIRLLESIWRHAGDVRLVFASSGGTVYGRIGPEPAREDRPLAPTGAHGLSKATVERYIDFYAQNRGVDAITLRIGNSFGADQKSARVFGAVTTFCAEALAGRPLVIFGDGSIVRDYLYIDDVVDALITAAEISPLHRHFNIGSGIGLSLNEVIDAVSEALGRRPRVERREARDFDLPVSVLDISRARTELGWQPNVPFREGLLRTLDGLRRQGIS